MEQLTFLLFLKMADEQAKSPYLSEEKRRDATSTIPKGKDWPALLAQVARRLSVAEEWKAVVNRKHGLPRIAKLRSAKPTVAFLSVEPLLEDLGQFNLSGIHWVIVGGESRWAFRVLDQKGSS